MALNRFDLILSAVFVIAISSANLLVAWIGPWWSPINSILLIGLDLSLRDKLHDRWGDSVLSRMCVLISIAGIVSYLINPSTQIICIASVLSFVAASISDMIVYHIRRHKPFLDRSNSSNLAGSAVDSILFPTLAFGVFMPEIVFMQFVAKSVGGFIWSLVLKQIHNPTIEDAQSPS